MQIYVHTCLYFIYTQTHAYIYIYVHIHKHKPICVSQYVTSHTHTANP